MNVTEFILYQTNSKIFKKKLSQYTKCYVNNYLHFVNINCHVNFESLVVI